MRRLRIYLTRAGLMSILQPDVTPSVGLLYLAAYVRRQFDVELRVTDQRAEAWSAVELARDIVEFKPDILGISYVTNVAYLITQIVDNVRLGLPDLLVVLGCLDEGKQRIESLDRIGTVALQVFVGVVERLVLSLQRLLHPK